MRRTTTPTAAGPISVWTRGRGPTALALHGFTGSGRDWESLPWPGRLVAPDLPGHGASRLEPEAISVATCAQLLSAAIPAESPQLLIGYSMGGRTAIRLALEAPGRVAGLVLVGATAGIESPRARARRAAEDEARAARVLAAGVPAFQAEWEQMGLLRSQLDLPAAIWGPMRKRRLANRAEGLAASLRGMGTGAMEPLWERLGELTMPTLIVVGEHDAKYRAIAERLMAALPRPRLAVLAGAGHCAWLEAPSAFATSVGSWCADELGPDWGWQRKDG